MPLVSIVTCFLNEGRFLTEAIDSVLKQEYTHWELLLVDDGSTDKSTDIAKAYADKYPHKIFYNEHEAHANKGLSASRNLAIKKAKGEFIAFLDGDDVWLPKLLQETLKIIQQTNAAMICEASEYWYDWDGTDKKNEIIPVGTKQDHLHLPPQLAIDLYPLGKGAAPCPCGMLIRKEVLKKHGGFNESFKGMYEDQVLLSKVYLHETVFVSSSCNNLYRQRPGSLVEQSHRSGKYYRDREKYLNWFEQYLKENKINISAVNILLHLALFPYRKPIRNYFLNILPMKGKLFIQRVKKRILK